jgi:serine/threonine protein kinase
VRPANLWINQSEQIKLMEFGAARDALSFLDRLDNDEALTRQETVLGDFHYTPPETARDARAASPASDVYSLGCTLYHALAGQPPFVHKSPLWVMQMHATEPPRPLDLQVPGIPRGLADIVDRMLAKSPEERPRLNEVDWALQPLDNNSPVVSTAAEQVWNPEYLAWVREVNQIEPVTAGVVEAEAEGSDELTEFLEWIINNQSER